VIPLPELRVFWPKPEVEKVPEEDEDEVEGEEVVEEAWRLSWPSTRASVVEVRAASSRRDLVKYILYV
jgi:hypothetical protein